MRMFPKSVPQWPAIFSLIFLFGACESLQTTMSTAIILPGSQRESNKIPSVEKMAAKKEKKRISVYAAHPEASYEVSGGRQVQIIYPEASYEIAGSGHILDTRPSVAAQENYEREYAQYLRDLAAYEEKMRERQSRASIDSVHEYFGKLISNAYPFKPEMGDASNNAKLQKKAWRRVARSSQARWIDEDHIRIDVFGGVFRSVDEMEYSLLARAAGETNRSGEEAFEISYLSYQGATPLDSLTPSLRVHDKTRIGSYSALLREREFQDGFSNMSRLSQKKLVAVIHLLPAARPKASESFDASPVYLNMLNAKLFDGLFPYPRPKNSEEG